MEPENSSPWRAIVRDNKLSLWSLGGPDVRDVRTVLRALGMPFAAVTTRQGDDAGYIVAVGGDVVYSSLEDAARRLNGLVVSVCYGAVSCKSIIFPRELLRRPSRVDVYAIAARVEELATEIFRDEEERVLWDEQAENEPADWQLADYLEHNPPSYASGPKPAPGDLPDDLPF
jgi:hypothetical protein